MNEEALRVVKRLEREDTENRKRSSELNLPHAKYLERPEEKMLALHPDTARLAHIIIQAARFKNLVEVGVSHGYSTVWLADAARMTGGRLKAIDINPRSIDIGRRNLTEAGLADWVDFVVGDALEVLPGLEGQVDFVLLDCWEDVYVPCLKRIVPQLRPGAILFADNVTPGMPESDEYVEALSQYPQLESLYVPIGLDLEISIKSLSADG